MKSNVIPLNAEKKKKKETNVVFSDEEKDDLNELGLNSFVTEYKRLRKKVTSDDFASDDATYQLLRAQLAAVIRAIGVADKAFIASSGRNAYGYVAVHTLAREIAHDLKSFGDNTQTIERVRNEVVQPLLSNLATKIVAAILDSRKKLNTQLKDRDAKRVSDELRFLQESMANLFLTAEEKTLDKLSNILNSKS